MATETGTVPVEPSANDVVLDVRDLRKTFGSGAATVVAVDGIDLTVHRGETIIISGPSGAGKTTLVTLLGGILTPTSGTVCIGGRDVGAMSAGESAEVRRSKVGVVFQTFGLLDALTARENVEVALNLVGKGGASARRQAESLLTRLGMEQRLHAKPPTLSGGERQRVAIARALMNDPELILADEPTANLDSKQGRQVADILRTLADTYEVAVVIVSHDQRIYDIADRLLWLEDGHLTLPPSSSLEDR